MGVGTRVYREYLLNRERLKSRMTCSPGTTLQDLKSVSVVESGFIVSNTTTQKPHDNALSTTG